MTITVQSEDSLLTGPASFDNGRQGRAAGLAGSALLHGLALSLLFLALPPGSFGSQRDVLSIPVEVSLGEDVSPAKREAAASSSSGASGAGPAAPLDPLDAKLKALAELHQPDAATASEGSGSGKTS